MVKSPDRVRDLDSSRLREVDASIRTKVGTADILITVECRKRNGPADVTWIEQLATKRAKVGAAKTIAVSAKGFSASARLAAERYGIELRVLNEITSTDIDTWFTPSSSLHLYRSIEAFICNVELTSGATHVVDGMEVRFRHPQVHGTFPASVFASFIEMKEPKAFVPSWLSDEPRQNLKFVLDGRDPNLIPVPLGEIKKEGVLEFLEHDPVRRKHIRHLRDSWRTRPVRMRGATDRCASRWLRRFEDRICATGS